MSGAVESFRGEVDGFLVAHRFEGARISPSTERGEGVFGIPLGEVETRVRYEFATDLGVDLDGPDVDLAISCDDDSRRCTWLVPDPVARPPAIDTASISVSQDRKVLIRRRVEARWQDEAISRLTAETEAFLQSEGFWSLNREAVRAGLRLIAKQHIVPVDQPVYVEVVFASEALSASGGIQGSGG